MSNIGGEETPALGSDELPVAPDATTEPDGTDGEVNVDDILTQFDSQPQVDETENAQEQIAPESEMESPTPNQQTDREESIQDEDEEVRN